MDVQVSHRFCAEVSKESILWGDKKRRKRHTETTVFQKGVEVLEGELCPDHVHLLVAIPPKLSVSHFMGYLKGKSSLMIYEKYGNLKYKYRGRQFWCREYYVDTTGKNTKKIQEYIQNQLKKDEEMEQLTLEGLDPFTGKKR